MREIARLRKLRSGFVTTFKRLFKSVWELYFVSYCITKGEGGGGGGIVESEWFHNMTLVLVYDMNT